MDNKPMSQEVPWQYRKDWVSGVIQSANGKAVSFWWFFTIVWLLLSAPAVIQGIPQKLDSGDYADVVAIAVFPIIGAMLLLYCIYISIRWLKFKDCELHLKDIPGVIGGHVRVEIFAPRAIHEFKSMDFQLGCYRKMVVGSGRHRRVTKSLLWMNEVRVSKMLSTNNGRHFIIPANFTVPFFCKSSDNTDANDEIYWLLHASCALPGVDFSAEFTVPVYKTEASNPDITGAIEASSAASASTTPSLEGIQISPTTRGGMRLKLPSGRFASAALPVFIFSLLWFAITLFVHIKGAPFWMVAVFYFVGFLVAMLALHWLLVQSELLVERGKVRIKRSWLGLGPVTEFSVSDLKEIRIASGATTTSDMAKDRVQYTIDFILTNDTRLSLGEVGDNNEEVNHLASLIKGWTEKMA